MLIFLLVYFIPFTVCILFAKFQKDPGLDKPHLIKCAMYPIANIITMIGVIYHIILKLVK